MISLAADQYTKQFQKPKLNVGNFVRVAKKIYCSRKVTNKTTLTKFFKLKKLLLSTHLHTDYFYYIHCAKPKSIPIDDKEVDKEKDEDTVVEEENIVPWYQKFWFRSGENPTLSSLMYTLRESCKADNLTDGWLFQTDEALAQSKMELQFQAYAGWTFRDRNIPNILGFRGVETTIGNHIGNDGISKYRKFAGDFPVDLIYGITLIFVYMDLIEYQNTGDVKAPILRIIDSGKRVQDGKALITQNHLLIYNTKSCLSTMFKQLAYS